MPGRRRRARRHAVSGSPGTSGTSGSPMSSREVEADPAAAVPSGRAPVVLMLPGRGNSGPSHWQTRWEQRRGDCVRIEQREWHAPRREDWVATLVRTVGDLAPAPVILVAHSMACSLVAHWAAAGEIGTVAGALLVSTSDVDSPDWPAGPIGFSPMPLARMPFPTIVVASTDDPRVSVARSLVFARAWGAEHHVIGARGHINADSGLGDWPEGEVWLERLIARARGGP